MDYEAKSSCVKAPSSESTCEAYLVIFILQDLKNFMKNACLPTMSTESDMVRLLCTGQRSWLGKRSNGPNVWRKRANSDTMKTTRLARIWREW